MSHLKFSRLTLPLTKIGTIYTQVLQNVKDISNDTQIGVIGSMEPEIRTKMFRNLREKLAAKFPATKLNYSILTVARLHDAFSEIFPLEASPVEGQSLQQKEKKKTERRGGKK